jgi:hypothetical protein
MKSTIFWDITPRSPLKKSTDVSEEHIVFYATASQWELFHFPPASYTIRNFEPADYSAYSTVKMATTYSSETSVDFQRTTRRYISENCTLQSCDCILIAWHKIWPYRWRQYVSPKRRWNTRQRGATSYKIIVLNVCHFSLPHSCYMTHTSQSTSIDHSKKWWLIEIMKLITTRCIHSSVSSFPVDSDIISGRSRREISTAVDTASVHNYPFNLKARFWILIYFVSRRSVLTNPYQRRSVKKTKWSLQFSDDSWTQGEFVIWAWACPVSTLGHIWDKAASECPLCSTACTHLHGFTLFASARVQNAFSKSHLNCTRSPNLKPSFPKINVDEQ